MFSFLRLSGSDPRVGVEMQSTGEVHRYTWHDTTIGSYRLFGPSASLNLSERWPASDTMRMRLFVLMHAFAKVTERKSPCVSRHS